LNKTHIYTFAVVAEEVRKLAEQSQEAAKKIAELIGEIQVDTDKAVATMNDGTREVKTGAEVVNAAGIAFREIAGLVTLSGQVKEISAAMQQMATGSHKIVDSVKKRLTTSARSQQVRLRAFQPPQKNSWLPWKKSQAPARRCRSWLRIYRRQ